MSEKVNKRGGGGGGSAQPRRVELEAEGTEVQVGENLSVAGLDEGGNVNNNVVEVFVEVGTTDLASGGGAASGPSSAVSASAAASTAQTSTNAPGMMHYAPFDEEPSPIAPTAHRQQPPSAHVASSSKFAASSTPTHVSIANATNSHSGSSRRHRGSGSGGLLRSSNAGHSSRKNTQPSIPQATPTQVDEIILRAISELRLHSDHLMRDLRESHRRDVDRVLMAIQQESAKRTALEGRLHSQLLLQSETMVAMELKLLRLEAKVERREAALRQRRQLLPATSASTASSSVLPGIGLTQTLPTIAATNTAFAAHHPSSSFPHDAIDEEDDGDDLGSRTPGAVHVSSAASLASAVSATTFLDGESTHHDDGASAKESTINDGSSDDGDVEDEGDGGHDDGSASRSRNPIATLDSILLNPVLRSDSSIHGTSTRATRGDVLTDGNSSLATSVTSATLTSTVITATTRGGDSIANTRNTDVGSTGGTRSRPSDDATHDDDHVGDRVVDVANSIVTDSNLHDHGGPLGLSPTNHDEDVEAAHTVTTANGLVLEAAQVDPHHHPHHQHNHNRAPRSRSQSPLTVHSATTASVGPQSVASASIGTSILSSAAVAPSRSFGTRRAAAAHRGGSFGEPSRPLANRVVSFTSNEVFAMAPPPEAISEAGDSITMPDELDNLSDVADAFASSSRLWREEYEARLDAIQKRWATTE